MASGKKATFAIWIVGMAALVGLTVGFGVEPVAQAFVRTGWATVFVVAVRAAAVAIAGVGWWLLFPGDRRPSLALCVVLRFVREAANALLPLAQIGGDVIGARCLALKGVRATVAAASVIVDVLMQAASQLAFAVIGFVLLLAMGGHEVLEWPIAIGITIAIAALAIAFLAQGERGYRIVTWLLSLFAGGREWKVFGTVDDLFGQLDRFYGYRRGLFRSGLWHLAGWFVGATEVWIVLHFMGYPITYEQAVILESLMHAVRGAAFAIPGALGAQEGALILLCSMFAVPPETALALSLVKRVPDLVLGVPGLAAWQVIEGRHWHAGRSRARDQNERA
jgi:putative membrane protein